MESKLDGVILNEESLYKFDEAYNDNLLKEKPWTKE